MSSDQLASAMRIGVDPSQFHLIAPFELDPRKWLEKPWIDQYSGDLFYINTSGNYSSRRTARVKTYGDVISEYEFHPEAKCASSQGQMCEKQTSGLLKRRHLKIDVIKLIGKESNSLEEVDAGTIHSTDSVYTEYADTRRDEWETVIRPKLKEIPISALAKSTGLSRRTLIDARTGRRRPRLKNQAIIVAALRKLGVI